MKIIKADILSEIDPKKITIILHGCNCQHVMGGGIARYLRDKFPQIYDADLKTALSSHKKLGTSIMVQISETLIVLNCYTQFDHDSRRRQVNYEALYSCLEDVAKQSSTMRPELLDIRAPQIGCGLAGGEWSIVEPMFEYLLPSAAIYTL